MTDPTYLWSPRIYTLPQFVTEYRSRLLALVEVETGHHGLDDMHTYSSEEMFFIYDIMSQKRVVCRDKTNRQFSIPCMFSMRFRVLDKKKPPGKQLGPTQPLWEIVDDWDGCMILHIVLDDTANISFCVNNQLDQSIYFDELEVIDIYDESYLVANPINDGEMYLAPVLIPVYVSIDLKVATGLDKEYCDKKNYMKWEEFLEKYSNLVKGADTSKLKLNAEIIELPESSDLYEDPYDYIEPKNFFYLNKEQLRKNLEEVEGKDPPPVPPKTYKEDNSSSRKASIDEKTMTLTSLFKKTVSIPSMAKLSDAMMKVKGRFNSFRSDFGKGIVRGPGRIQAQHMDEYESHTSDSEDEEVYDYIDLEANPIAGKMKAETKQNMYEKSPKTQTSGRQELAKSTKLAPPVAPKPKVIKKPVILEAVVKPQPVTRRKASESQLEEVEEEEDIYGMLAKVPSDLSALTVTDVSNVLKTLNMDSQMQVFAENHVDGKLLITLNEDILRKDFGCSGFKARKLMLFVSGWRPTK